MSPPPRTCATGRLVIALAWSGFLLGHCGPDAIGAESIDDPATPIPYGYLFFEYRFIPGPYVIIASGQSVSVNGIVVAESFVTPRRPPPPEKDPTANAPPPPPDLSGYPGDGEKDSDDYWEWRRLTIMATEKDLLRARALLIQEMNAYYRRTVAIPDPHGADSILSLYDEDGKQHQMGYSMRGRWQGSFTDDDPVATAIRGKELFADLLRRHMWKDRVLWVYEKGSGYLAVNPDFSAQFLHELLVDASPEVRYANLMQKGLINHRDDLWVKLVHGMTDLTPLRNELRMRKERLLPKREPPAASVTPPGSVPADVIAPSSESRRAPDVTPSIAEADTSKAMKSVSYARMAMGTVAISACLILFYLLFFRRRG